MKINSITQQQNRQNFTASFKDAAANFLTKHPKAPAVVAGLAGSSVIAQKVVMSGSEATIGPAMDIGVGKAITKFTDEKDDRTNQSSKVQAVRTFAQSVGGTITGVIIRGVCIAASTAVLAKLGTKAGSKIGQLVADGLKPEQNLYKYKEKMTAWGKSLGGAIAIGVMMFTNFLIDAPFINWINKKSLDAIEKFKNRGKTSEAEQKTQETIEKEAK